jgi:hypothetical protein
MNLELRSIVAPNELKSERLTLRANADLDIGDYLVAQSGFVDGSPTTSFFHTLWFPFKLIQKSDLVVVYTKVGTNNERVLNAGNKAHFFYLDLSQPIWGDTSKGALVLYAPTWQSKSVDDLKRS